jgi:hypothetical protein
MAKMYECFKCNISASNCKCNNERSSMMMLRIRVELTILIGCGENGLPNHGLVPELTQ